ncbi:MAG: hypothetical protein IJT91_04085 [Clostridia bacterium]|nr:hypothetical protein [Clostridia bacterium]
MKKILSFLLISVLLASAAAYNAYADIVWEPDSGSNTFFDKNKKDFSYALRTFFIDDSKESVDVYSEPNGEVIDKRFAGDTFWGNYFYTDESGTVWEILDYYVDENGLMVEDEFADNVDRNEIKEIVGWARLEDLSIPGGIDGFAFAEEHKDELVEVETTDKYGTKAYEIDPGLSVYYWTCPGYGPNTEENTYYDHYLFFTEDPDEQTGAKKRFVYCDNYWTDEDGNRWGYVNIKGFSLWLNLFDVGDPVQYAEKKDVQTTESETVTTHENAVTTPEKDVTTPDNSENKNDGKLVWVLILAAAVVVVTGVVIAVVFGKNKGNKPEEKTDEVNEEKEEKEE